MLKYLLPALLCISLSAQDTPDRAKPETLVIKPERTIEFDTDEATWMSVDISPDGRTLLVDMLGDLYTLPVTGGALQPLTKGMEWDYQARYSPDGKQIAFVSDRGGSDNIWIMNTDGSEPHALTKEKRYMFGSPAWSPDGQYIAVRRYGTYPNESYLRGSELWLFHKDGGAGIQLTKLADPRTSRVSGPTFSPDGKYIYFSGMAGRFNYNSEIGKWQVNRYNRDTAEIDVLTSEYGGGLRPLISPDGRQLIYASRRDAVTGLRVRDLESRAEHWISRHITRDDQEGFSTEDTLPGYAISRDGKTVVLAIDGKLHRLDFPSGEDHEIKFTGHVKRELGKLVKFEDKIDDGPMNVKQMRWLQATADGSLAVMSAVGKIWIVERNGAPRRLTNSPNREYSPSLSADGKWVAYVTWSDKDGGHLWKAPLPSGAPVELSTAAAFYSQPEWSPDGKTIAFLMGSASAWVAYDASDTFEIRTMPAAGGKSSTVTHVRSPNSKITWAGNGERIYYNESQVPVPPATGRATSTLLSIRLDGVDKKTHIKFSDEAAAIPSPDEQWMVLISRSNAYLAALPRWSSNEGLALNLEQPAVPLKQITTTGATYPRWSADSATISWAFTNHLYSVARADALKAAKAVDIKPSMTQFALAVPRDRAKGILALRNARLLTMKGNEVVERGDVLIENGRIKAVGPRGSFPIPAGAQQMDLAGKTIMPGIVDIHAHLRARGDVFPDTIWAYAANLAYGVTTTRDPSIDSNLVFPYAEMVEAGEILGPRIYSTGTAMTTNAVKIESLEDARNAVKQYKEQGADYLKQYMQPRRLQRQWILQAAQENGINVTAEGGGFFKEDIAMAIDGYTGFEHSLPYELHKDAVELLARSQTVYTPTLIVAYGGWFGQYYWRQRTNYHADEKLGRFTPHKELDQKTRRRSLLLDEEYFFPVVARGVEQVRAQGGNVALGSHGEQQGVGAQWEMWMMAMGGMKPLDTLRSATLDGARALGLDKDIGSIEPGKLADLVVLDKNPLDNIQNSDTIRYVIKSGDVWEGESLNQVWPAKKEMRPAYWASDK